MSSPRLPFTLFNTPDSGYGYQVRIVSDLPNLDNDLAASLEWALSEISIIQKAARSGRPIIKPRWPILILRTPKGLSGPKSIHGQIVEGSFRSHQVPLPAAKTDPEELDALKDWLGSYGPHHLFDLQGNGGPVKEILTVIPVDCEKKMGQRKESYKSYQPLCTPDWNEYCVKKGEQESCMKAIGRFLKEVVKEQVHSSSLPTINLTFLRNPKSFRIFSPDELVSNKLDAVLEDSSRNFQWDDTSRAKGGRVIEILSEHTCQGMLQGYTLTGRTGLFPSYEAFLGIIHTMMVQYSKFAKMASLLHLRLRLRLSQQLC